MYASTARSSSRVVAAAAIASACCLAFSDCASFFWTSSIWYLASLYCSITSSRSCPSCAALALAASTSALDGAAEELRVKEPRTTGRTKTTATKSRVIRDRALVMISRGSVDMAKAPFSGT